MNKKILPKEAINVWQIRGTLLSTVASFICGVIGVFDFKFCCTLFLGIVFTYLLYLVYCKKKYLMQNYYLAKHSLIVEKGVLFKSIKEVPINKVLCSDIVVLPDEKLLGLCSLHFFTLGSKITFSQIKYTDALLIRSKIIPEEKNEI